jgi:hypothetical protein
MASIRQATDHVRAQALDLIDRGLQCPHAWQDALQDLYDAIAPGSGVWNRQSSCPAVAT